MVSINYHLLSHYDFKMKRDHPLFYTKIFFVPFAGTLPQVIEQSLFLFYVERIEKASAVYDKSIFQKLVLQMNSQHFAKLINRKKRRSRFR